MSKLPLLLPTLALAAAFLSAPCGAAETPEFLWPAEALALPAWMENQVIYEVNVRQYSPEGTLRAVMQDFDRIARLGAKTLWLMPIHPIGQVNRKGPLGSYYSVADYYGVNPEFGTKEDFRAFMEAARARGLRVLLDWVANHSAWDNPAARDHPELYLKNAEGSFVPPLGTDWTDVIQFDAAQPGLVDYHAEAMLYWVREFGVDGFRCDFALGLPVGFWDQVSARLRAIRPDLFLLAESEQGALQVNAFHATYGWAMMHAFNRVAQGKQTALHLDAVLAARRLSLPRGGRELLMTSNHDENTWLGTVFERLGGGVRPFAVLTLTMDGVPMIYNGQEAGLDRRLKFFEKDPIDWRPSPLFAFYEKLVALRTTHPALKPGRPTTKLPTTKDEHIRAFVRGGAAGEGDVLVLVNLTAENLSFTVGSPLLEGVWRDAFTGEERRFGATETLAFESWAYRVFSR